MKYRKIADLILVNKKGQVLLQHRTNNAVTYPNKWCIFGGGIEKGETPLQGVTREIKEELNYDVKNPKLILKTQFHDERYNRKLDFWVFTEKYDEKQRLILGEGQAKKWCGFEDLEKLDMIEKDKEILKKVWDKLNI